MRGALGCAGIIAGVALIFGIIGSLFVPGAGVGERVGLALMPPALAFVAALILIAKDRARHRSARRNVRRMLLSRQDVDEHGGGSGLSADESLLACQTREAISRFFDVPIGKIRLTDSLRGDLRSDLLDPTTASVTSTLDFMICSARMRSGGLCGTVRVTLAPESG